MNKFSIGKREYIKELIQDDKHITNGTWIILKEYFNFESVQDDVKILDFNEYKKTVGLSHAKSLESLLPLDSLHVYKQLDLNSKEEYRVKNLYVFKNFNCDRIALNIKDLNKFIKLKAVPYSNLAYGIVMFKLNDVIIGGLIPVQTRDI